MSIKPTLKFHAAAVLRYKQLTLAPGWKLFLEQVEIIPTSPLDQVIEIPRLALNLESGLLSKLAGVEVEEP